MPWPAASMSMHSAQGPNTPTRRELPGSPTKASRAASGDLMGHELAIGKSAGPHFPWLALALGLLSAACCGIGFWLFFGTAGVSSL